MTLARGITAGNDRRTTERTRQTCKNTQKQPFGLGQSADLTCGINLGRAEARSETREPEAKGGARESEHSRRRGSPRRAAPMLERGKEAEFEQRARKDEEKNTSRFCATGI